MANRIPDHARAIWDGRFKIGSIAVTRSQVSAWTTAGEAVGTFPNTVDAIAALKQAVALTCVRAS